MAQGRGHGKSFGRSSPTIHVSMPTILMPTIVSPQQGGTPTVETSAQSNTPTISKTPQVTPNQSNPIDQGLYTQSIPTGRNNPIAEGDLSTQSNSRGHTNTVVEADSSISHSQTLIFISSAGKNMKNYYGEKKPLNQILINVKHTTKLPGEKRRKEYTVLDLKQKLTTDRIFVPHHL